MRAAPAAPIDAAVEGGGVVALVDDEEGSICYSRECGDMRVRREGGREGGRRHSLYVLSRDALPPAAAPAPAPATAAGRAYAAGAGVLLWEGEGCEMVRSRVKRSGDEACAHLRPPIATSSSTITAQPPKTYYQDKGGCVFVCVAL